MCCRLCHLKQIKNTLKQLQKFSMLEAEARKRLRYEAASFNVIAFMNFNVFYFEAEATKPKHESEASYVTELLVA